MKSILIKLKGHPHVQKGTAYTILFAMGFCHLLNDMIQSVIPAMYPVLKDNFGFTFAQIGIITLVFQLTSSVFQPFVGQYADRRPQPYSLSAGMCFTLTGLLLLAFASNFFLILLAVAIIGCGSSVFHPEASRVAQIASGGRKSLAQSIFQVGGNGGSAITFGHALMAYASMLLRDLQRFEDATARMDSQCPLGSGALAGTTYPLDRQFTAEKLGFAAPCANSLDGVSDRDFCIELANAISICMMHLSRLSEEIILWCSWEFKFIELDDAFTTGSSIMPQKKNPDVTELIRGKTGRVYGDLNTLLVMMKGIPLAYNKDMQEDKEAIFDAVDTLELCLKTVTPMLDTMKTIPVNMRRAAAKGFINATDCADYLTKKGMPFRDAYKLTGCMVSDCIAKDKTLEELTLDEFKGYSALFENDIYDAIDLVKCCEGRTSYGGPSEASVNNQIALANAQLDAWEEKNA